MIRIFGTIFAGLLGLAFGSFLNVCLTRWPQGESIVHPRSHCRNCDHKLSWWENIPLLSWLALRGRCRDCRTWIGWRYPLVELAVGTVWAAQVWLLMQDASTELLGVAQQPHLNLPYLLAQIWMMIFCWLLIALAVLDAECLWLPDLITLPGAALGFLFMILRAKLNSDAFLSFYGALGIQNRFLFQFAFHRLVGILAAALLILLIRWLYKLIRHREGIGLGDAKLMALLAAWLGLPGALLSFALGVVLGALVAVVLLIVPSTKPDPGEWSLRKLPLGTFLCIGGIISSLWGQPIIAAYLRWAGL
jgi:leader peptidase (prepilin peptidase) / N-methyltransferase